MAPKDMILKRARREVGLHDGVHLGCVSSKVQRQPNPKLPTRTGKLLQPTSYMVRSLPPKNPFHISPDRLCFGSLGLSTGKIDRKKLTTRLPSLEITTICDLDENFFKIVEGRSIVSNKDIKMYMNYIRDIAMSRASTAYLVDRIICLEGNALLESSLYDKSVDLFMAMKLNFMRFLREQNTQATVAQKRAKEMAERVAEKSDHLEAVAFRFVELRTAISAVRVECANLARYRGYLNRMSPLSWREKHDEIYQEQMSGWKGRALSVFFPGSDNVSEADDDLSDTSEKFILQLDPKLYFCNPEELMDLFEFLENQSLNYLQNSIHMATILNDVLFHRDNFLRSYDKEVKNIGDLMGIYEEHVIEAEEKEEELKRSFGELLHGTTRELVSSRESMQLNSSVEWVHEQLFGESLGRWERRQMMRRIEELYVQLGRERDLLEGSVVREAEREYFAQEARRAVEARRARTQLVQWANINRALHAAFEPPFKKSPNKLPNIVNKAVF